MACRKQNRQIGSYILTRVGGCQAYDHAPVDYDTLLCSFGRCTDRRGLLGESSPPALSSKVILLRQVQANDMGGCGFIFCVTISLGIQKQRDAEHVAVVYLDIMTRR